MFSHADDVVHSGGRPGVWLKAGPGNQELMIRDDPRRFFRPPYVGAAGWIGVRLDEDPPWDEIATLVEDSWRLIAPKKLLKAREEGTVAVGGKKRPAMSKRPVAKLKPTTRSTSAAKKK